MEIIIDYNVKKEKYDEIASIVAKDLRRWQHDVSRFSSVMIMNKSVNLLIMLSKIFEKPVDEIMDDRDSVAMIVNSAFFTEVMERAVRQLDVHHNIRLLLDEKFLSKDTLQDWVTAVQKDFVVSMVYFLYEGGTGEYYRSHVGKKVDKNFMKIRKECDFADFITMLSRGLHVLNHMRETIFRPRLDELEVARIAKSQDPGRSINSMAAAFSAINGGVK